MKHLILFFIVISYSSYSFGQKSTNKPVTTYLNAKWPQTPFILEAAEYLVDESSILFWSFIEEVNKLDLKSYAKKNEKDKLDAILQVTQSLLSPSQIDLLKFSLALRVYSPKIESFRQIALDRDVQKKGCKAAVEINNDLLCFPFKAEDIEKKAAEESSDVVYFDIDHSYNEIKKNVVILYAELGTEEFKSSHQILKTLADKGSISYVLRPYVQDPSEKKLRLSGFGVELQIKSTEYKAQDDTKLQEDLNVERSDEEGEEEVEGFLFGRLKTLYPDQKEKLNQLKAQLLESSQDMAPLRVWQLQHLSMQAAQRIMSHNETEQRMDSFINIAQNFPSVARSLIRTKVDDKLKKEIQKNQNLFRDRFDVSATDSSLSINGVLFEIESVDIFVLLDFIKSEQKVMERLHNLGLKGDTLANLQNLDMSENKQQYGIDIRDTAISFLNNIEKDKAYARWPSSIGELLRPTYPGMLRSIRKNLHNFVILADPTQKQSIDLLKTVHVFLGHVSPLRFGIVWSVKSDRKVTGFEDAGVALVCAFNYVVMSFDEEAEDKNIKGMKFILDFHAAHKNDVISPSDVTTYFKSKYKSEDLDDVFGADSEFDFGRQLAAQFVEKGSFKKFPQALFNGVPLPQEELTEESFEELLLMEVMKSTQNFQKALFSGEISDNHDPIDYLMDKPNIMPKINERILTTKQSKYINLSEAAPVKKSLLGISHEDFIKLSPSQMTDVIANSCRYITFRNDATIRPLTVWVVADFETELGRDVLREAVKYTRESNEIRICALSNSENPGFLSKVVQVAQDTLPGAITRQLLSKILDPENIAKMDSGEKNWKDFHVKGLDKDAFESRLTNFKDHVLKSHMHYSSKVLGMPVGRSTVVANGRMLGVFLPEEVFSEDDFALLEKFSFSSIGEKISTVLNKETPPEDGDLSDLFMKVASVLQSKPQSRPRTPITVKSDQFSVIKLGPKDPSSPAFDILAICDPVSTGAQKIGPLIKAIHEVTNANVRIVLNAVDRHSEMPLKRFYRYILHTEPQFTKSGDIAQGPLAKFTGLSDTTIYTQSYDTPDNWLVEAVNSLHDLDNIKLEQVESGVHSEFELEYLLLEGHCFEQSTGNPPRGLQFTLGTRQNPLRVDTIVMANLGYFQLKASPGAMVLRLREGRSSDIYNIAGHEGTESPLGTSDIMVLINSFRSHLVKIKVAKKPSKADQDLLYDEEDSGGGIWETISSTFGNSDKEDAAEDEYINIFSVASGHLYERFLRIMMVSVRKHSSKPVKFWLIKNFLSPTFKNLLPVLANAFDFEYELVQYKWPRWLHQQTEKQRIIWGYKVLFLDVLFPLHVKKIIFVDADQVVRADIKELHDLDLGGAPYGFVPFCDSRKEMDGFRFWKQGYWRSHLAGRKYHISALFVVDLKKFRQIAAGDRLRGQYQGLSQDPNSLSNLDQDLPNNMVHQVKIKSLPQDWLWCETWCDDSSKSSAKIIDLCNNPLTKEAKLNAAQRIISEWSSLDEDVKNSLKGQSQQKTDQKPKEDPKNVEL